jgi:hypothetical protein
MFGPQAAGLQFRLRVKPVTPHVAPGVARKGTLTHRVLLKGCLVQPSGTRRNRRQRITPRSPLVDALIAELEPGGQAAPTNSPVV